MNATATTTEALADAVQVAASALAAVARLCEKGLPDDEAIATILPGYPFAHSLDEVTAQTQAWADSMREAGL